MPNKTYVEADMDTFIGVIEYLYHTMWTRTCVSYACLTIIMIIIKDNRHVNHISVTREGLFHSRILHVSSGLMLSRVMSPDSVSITIPRLWAIVWRRRLISSVSMERCAPYFQQYRCDSVVTQMRFILLIFLFSRKHLQRLLLYFKIINCPLQKL